MAKRLTQTEILQAVLECKEKLGLDTLPNSAQLAQETGFQSYTIKCLGGLTGISEMTGIPMAKKKRPKRHTKVANTEEFVSRKKPKPSRAFEIEAEQRKQGLSYKDYQMADTLKREAGKAW